MSKQLEELHSTINELPEGKLLCAKNGMRVKWYLSNGSKPIYIPKKDLAFVQALACKKYLLLQAEETSYHLTKINQFLSTYQAYPHKSINYLSLDSPYRELLLPYFESATSSNDWASSYVSQNTKHPEHLIHKCLSGHLVRSKSEVIIANSLYINQIPYRYECELLLDNVSIFPDFTIKHPVTDEIFYWEHFGLMDIKSYQESTYNKLKIYASNGIIPTINLIATYETSKHPIDSAQIQRILEDYFL